jgi:hypothetical protein
VRSRRSSVRRTTAWTSDLTIGLLGTGVGKAFQQFVHRNISHDVDPGGWSHQISNGGELTAKYRLAFRWKAFQSPPVGRWPTLYDFTLSPEVNAGYYTNVAGGGRLRVGLIDSSPLTIERHASEPWVANGVVAEAVGSRTRPKTEAYIWGTAGATLWGYNALLQGQFSESDVMLKFGEGPAPLKRLVGEWQAGATVRRKRVTFTWTWRSDHTALFGGGTSRKHSWGSLAVTVRPKGFDGYPPI